MSVAANLYPPSPAGVPADLTAPTSRYRLWVIAVLVSLLLFLLLYLAMVVGSAFLCYLAVVYPLVEVNKATVLIKLGSIACSAMLFLFLLKGLFKRHKADEPYDIEITETSQPELFAFIRQLCQDTRAPFPYRIFLAPEVNASVFYNTSLLNLIVPVRKNLRIGLGLVNAVPLSEFKATLAHEFGHFSQKSMALGTYVYVANRIIGDMVFARDKWDDLLAQWRRQDFRIAVFGWILYGIVWALRKILEGVFRVINLAELALSRQMEFNADLVAVSVTGSDAIPQLLYRLDFASACLGQAAHDLSTAADHRLYTRDLYYHQTQAADYLRRVQKDSNWGVPPALPEDPNGQAQIFQPEPGADSIWLAHPSHYQREQNAKRRYVRSPIDDRSAWLLFRNAEAVREAMTRRFYKVHFNVSTSVALSESTNVQSFIDEEHAETTYDEKYHGLYDNRYVEPGNPDALAQAAASQPWHADRLAQACAQTYGDSLKDVMEQHARRQGEYELLSGLDRGEYKLKGKTFEFRNRQCSAAEVKTLLQTVEKELDTDHQRLNAMDRTVFLVHYQMACYFQNGTEQELLSRYRFHLAAQDILRRLLGEKARIEAVLNFISTHEQLSESQAKEVIHHFQESHQALADSLSTAASLPMPALKNVQAGTSLGDFLMEGDIVPSLPEGGNSISGEWIGKFLQQMGGMIQKMRRVHFKSLGGILALQEQIAEEWHRRWNAARAASV